MHSLMQVPVKSPVFGRFCFAHPYRGRSETYRQRNINGKHTVNTYIHGMCSMLHENKPAKPNIVEVANAARHHFDTT